MNSYPRSRAAPTVRRRTLPGIALEREPANRLDVAEHARGGLLRVGPRQQLERGGVGPGQHVGLVDPAEPVYRAAVELHALTESSLKLSRRYGHRLELPEHIGEPEPNQAHAALLRGPQSVVLLLDP